MERGAGWMSIVRWRGEGAGIADDQLQRQKPRSQPSRVGNLEGLKREREFLSTNYTNYTNGRSSLQKEMGYG